MTRSWKQVSSVNVPVSVNSPGVHVCEPVNSVALVVSVCRGAMMALAEATATSERSAEKYYSRGGN